MNHLISIKGRINWAKYFGSAIIIFLVIIVLVIGKPELSLPPFVWVLTGLLLFPKGFDGLLWATQAA